MRNAMLGKHLRASVAGKVTADAPRPGILESRPQGQPVASAAEQTNERAKRAADGNLEVVEGISVFAGGKAYHPLEASLVGVNVSSGDWRADVGTTLGVEPAWFRGFLDGFAQEREHSRAAEYVQGYLVPEQLRVMRYRRELPDK
jgi:hypothetical protein